MRAERWPEVQRLYGRALEQPDAEREAFVRREAGADAELVSEVLRMLAAEDSPGFIEPPEVPPEPPESNALPREMGDFELIEEIGRGGMGVVYRARQRSLGRIVAVKVLPVTIATTARQIDRFQREPRTVGQLDHPNIVKVFTVGVENGTRYFAMEFVKGPNLADELKRLREEKGAEDDSAAHLPSSQAESYFRRIAELVRQAADGLHYAHQHKKVHRDVKPSNLLLDEQGSVRIVDFGLARDEELGTLTRSGELAGTPHYMSPEQARASRHQVDHRTDVYSLGVVMYELLTLRRPFEGRTSQEIITSILQREAPKIRRINPRVPRDLEVICTTAMAKAADQRYSSAGELRDDLARFLAYQAIHARPPSPWQVAVRGVRRHRRSIAAAGLVLAALGGGILYSNARAHRARIAEHMLVIEAARAEGPLASLPITRALDLRRRLAELRAEPGVRAAEADTARALQREFDALRTTLRGQGVADLAHSRDVSQAEGVRELHRLAGLQTLLRASHIFPEDVELEQLASVESAYPTVAVSALDEAGTPTGADVFLRPIDPFTSGVGEKRLLGRAPLPRTPVLPGYYRAVVAFDAGGFRELVCNPGPAFMEIDLIATRRSDEASLTDGMVQFPSVQYAFPEFFAERLYRDKTVDLDAFWMDATEVSNARYQAFVQTTGHGLPAYWDLVPDLEAFLAEHGELPVVGVSWNDAVAFATWRGARLPTAAEWFRAASGLEGRPFPYAADPEAPPRGNVLASLTEPIGHEAQWSVYLAHAVPVDSFPEAATPEGIRHMFGNVIELTESMAATQETDDSPYLPRLHDRFGFGGTWEAASRRARMDYPLLTGSGQRFNDWYTGFRCARSASP